MYQVSHNELTAELSSALSNLAKQSMAITHKNAHFSSTQDFRRCSIMYIDVEEAGTFSQHIRDWQQKNWCHNPVCGCTTLTDDCQNYSLEV